MFVKYLLALLLTSASLISLPVSAQLTAGEAMNMTGLQRSLIQRMSKNYLMIGSEVRVDSASRQLAETIAQYDNAHRALSQYATTPETQAKLKEIGQSWESFRAQVSAKPNFADAVNLLNSSEALLVQAQQLTELMAQPLGEMGQNVNRSGWGRVQTQRIAMLYIAKDWGVQLPDLDSKMDIAVSDFEEVLKNLEARGTPNAAIATAMGRVQANWGFTLKGIDLHGKGESVPTSLTVSTDSLFRHMNKLTRLYAGLQD